VSCYELIAPAVGTISKSGPVSPSDRAPCTLENCGHLRQLDAIADFLGMPRGGVSVLGWLRAVRTWEDKPDEWTEEVKAAYPTRSGSHAEYGVAMQMVGNRRGKVELVALVNWLLVLLARGDKLPGMAPDPATARAARRQAAEFNAARLGWCSCPEPAQLREESTICSTCDKVIPMGKESC
jgi:hypothetical protein